MFHKLLDFGQAGDQLGALVRGIKRDEVKRGMVLCAPGTVKSHTKANSQVSLWLPVGGHKSWVTDILGEGCESPSGRLQDLVVNMLFENTVPPTPGSLIFWGRVVKAQVGGLVVNILFSKCCFLLPYS